MQNLLSEPTEFKNNTHKNSIKTIKKINNNHKN